MLIYLHIPKTAGTSLAISLRERFGAAYRFDEWDRPFHGETPLERKALAVSKALELRPSDFEGVACVHGHFLAFKYSLLAEQMPCTFVTWLRNPIDRLMSQYYYWTEFYAENPSYGPPNRCIAENWSFERFCMWDEFQNLQSKLMWGMPLSSFDFVGLTEHYDQDFARFSHAYLGGEVKPLRLNVTRTKPGIESLDSGLRRDITQFHAQDMALYYAAVARRRLETEAEAMRMGLTA